jgi:uncharacterized membrane protein YbhN (UPF0104 family)
MPADSGTGGGRRRKCYQDRRKTRSVMPSWVRTSLKLVFTVVILGFLVHLAGARNILVAFENLAWPWGLAMFGTALIRRFIISTQLWAILRQSGLSVSVIRVFLANTLSALYTLFLPGNIASAGVKWLDLSAATGKKAAVFNGLVYHRLVMTLLTLAIGGLALIYSNPLPYESLGYIPGILLVILGAFFVGIYHPRIGARLESVFRRIAESLPARVERYLNSVLDALRRIRGFSVYDHFRIFAWALLSVALRTLVLYFATRAIGVNVAPVHILWISAFLVFTATLPITIANLGVREGLLILALSPFGVVPATAVALGLLLFANQIIAALIGALYQLAISLGWVRWHGPPQPDTVR